MDPAKPPLPALAPAVRAVLGDPPTEHPEVEEICAYHEGRLPAESAERLRDHLALCPECTELLLDLADFPALKPPAGVRAPGVGEVAQAWQAMQSRLGGEGSPKKPSAPTGPHVLHLPPPAARPEPLRARPVQTWAMAASWLLVAGLGVWAAVLERENVQLRRPSAEVATVELQAAESTRGETGPAERKSVSAGHRAVLHLDAQGLPSLAGYKVEIAADGGSGRVEWRGSAERDLKENDFTVTLPAGFLHPGLYWVRLFGTGAGKAAPLAEFPLEVRAP